MKAGAHSRPQLLKDKLKIQKLKLWLLVPAENVTNTQGFSSLVCVSRICIEVFVDSRSASGTFLKVRSMSDFRTAMAIWSVSTTLSILSQAVCIVRLSFEPTVNSGIAREIHVQSCCNISACVRRFLCLRMASHTCISSSPAAVL